MTPQPHNPVRDDSKLAPTEDLDRDPDGVPHKVVAMTAGFSVVLALLLAAMFIAGGTARWMGVILAVVAVPVFVSKLNKKSRHDRDHAHPSR